MTAGTGKEAYRCSGCGKLFTEDEPRYMLQKLNDKVIFALCGDCRDKPGRMEYIQEPVDEEQEKQRCVTAAAYIGLVAGASAVWMALLAARNNVCFGWYMSAVLLMACAAAWLTRRLTHRG